MNSKSMLVWLWIMTLLAACNLPLTPPEPITTPSHTAIPSIIPTTTPTLTPPPTPTPLPIVRIADAQKALFNGDHERARAEFQTALDDSNDKNIQADALWGLARTEYEDSRYQPAIAALQQLTTDHPDSPHSAQAHFLLGQIYMTLERPQEAASEYAAYLSLRPGMIDSYAQELQGDALAAGGDYSGALSAYQSALQSPRLDDHMQLEIKTASTIELTGDLAGALALYEDIASRAENDYIKAQMDLFAGRALIALGQVDEGYQRYLHTVENYPLSYDSYTALVELVNANVPVDDLDRGLVDYFAGQYDIALVMVDRYIAGNPENDGTAHYYRGLILHDLDQYQEAIDEWSLFILKYPDNPWWATAWEDKSDTQVDDINDYSGAAQTLLDFVYAAPGHAWAPTYLLYAGRIMERADRLEEAAAIWGRLAEEYPGSDLSPQSLFWAGIAYFRLNDYAQALTSFQRSLLLSSKLEDQARAYLWIGKTQQNLGDQAAAQTAWQQAQALDPTGYYSERARDLLMGRAPFDPPSIYHPEIDPSTERAEAASWMRVTFDLPSDTDLTGPGPLLEDARMIRGFELWELGQYNRARLEFENLRESIKENPADTFLLANYMLDLGLYRSAIVATRQVLTLAGLDDHTASFNAPAYFNHVRYGFYYDDLIIQAAQVNRFHPLFLFSVVRQESLFEGFVRSSAGARGLMQIIPSTGASIAKSMGWPVDFSPEDLYRPVVSVRLGANYLATNRDLLGGSNYAALAAYNAGPGNAAIWNNLCGGDDDLLLEVIRYEETRLYIRYIYEIYNTYRTLYGSTF